MGLTELFNRIKIRHGGGDESPRREDLDNYELGYSDYHNELYIKNGANEIIDIGGMVTNKRLDDIDEEINNLGEEITNLGEEVTDNYNFLTTCLDNFAEGYNENIERIGGEITSIQTELNAKATAGSETYFNGVHLGSSNSSTPLIYSEEDDINFRYSAEESGEEKLTSVREMVDSIAGKAPKSHTHVYTEVDASPLGVIATDYKCVARIWSGSSLTPQFELKPNLYKFYLIQVGSIDQNYGTWIPIFWHRGAISGYFRGIGGFETEKNGLELYGVRGTVTSSSPYMATIQEVSMRKTNLNSAAGDNFSQVYVKGVWGVK